jgi:hypothetical protein
VTLSRGSLLKTGWKIYSLTMMLLG